jgi:DNA-binding transcriptional LysR family regulator
MTNIPTELLRTFVAVVDLRGFTKAAQALGCTQPAVSAQIKRLQNLLGAELLDKTAPGVIPTERGRAIAEYARRLLEINDQIIDLAAVRGPTTPLRIGIPGDLGGRLLPAALADFRRRFPHQAFQVRFEVSERLLRGLQNGDIDLAVTCTPPVPPIDAYDRWSESVVWVRGASAGHEPSGPVPLVAQGEDCVLTKLAMEALDRAGRGWEMVFIGPSNASVVGAVAAGLGISAMFERLVPAELTVWRDAPLPPLPDLTCGIYLRESHDRSLLEALAQAMAKVIRPPLAGAAPHGSLVERQAG